MESLDYREHVGSKIGRCLALVAKTCIQLSVLLVTQKKETVIDRVAGLNWNVGLPGIGGAGNHYAAFVIQGRSNVAVRGSDGTDARENLSVVPKVGIENARGAVTGQGNLRFNGPRDAIGRGSYHNQGAIREEKERFGVGERQSKAGGHLAAVAKAGIDSSIGVESKQAKGRVFRRRIANGTRLARGASHHRTIDEVLK